MPDLVPVVARQPLTVIKRLIPLCLGSQSGKEAREKEKQRSVT